MPFHSRVMQRALLVLVVALLTYAGGAGRSEANAAPPYFTQGQLAAEPSGVSTISIDHETLVIDMRKLPVAPERATTEQENAAGGVANPVTVTATYTLTNPGPAVTVDLVFVSGAPDTDGFAVTLNGQAISSRPAGDIPLPAEWQPPITTPALPAQPGDSSLWAGRDLVYLEPDESTYDYSQVNNFRRYPSEPTRAAVSTYAFTLTIPAGQSTLEASYNAEPQQFRSGGYSDRLESYQLAYVLAPARAWGGFGGLDVIVRVPQCWPVAARPQLERVGDELRGSFTELPADALALTVGPCAEVRPSVLCGSPLVVFLVLIGGLLAWGAKVAG